MQKIPLTKKQCIESAKSYDTPMEWRKNDPRAYKRAMKMKWKKDCYDHMSKKGHFPVTRERVLFALKDSKSRNDLNLRFYSEMKKLLHDKQYEGLLDKRFPLFKCLTTSTGENSTKLFLEKLFGESFKKGLHDFLINPKTGKKLELDGYCEKLKIAFEYGDHSRFKGDHLEKILYKDQFKKEKCEELGIVLLQITIDSMRFKNSADHLKKQILNQLEKFGVKIPSNFSSLQLDIIPEYGLKWNKKTIWKEVKKHDQVYDFQLEKGAAYEAAVRLGLIEEIRDYYKKKNDPNYGVEITKEMCIEILIACGGTNRAWQKANPRSYSFARKMGWYEEVREKGSKNKKKWAGRAKWTIDVIKDRIKGFKTVEEWIEKDYDSYDAAGDRGWTRGLLEQFEDSKRKRTILNRTKNLSKKNI